MRRFVRASVPLAVASQLRHCAAKPEQERVLTPEEEAMRQRVARRARFLGVALGSLFFPLGVWFFSYLDDRRAAARGPPTISAFSADGEKKPGESSSLAPGFSKGKVEMVSRPQLGGPFTLRDAHTNARVTDRDVFTGKWTLLYFGFAKCAEICPRNLSFLAQVLRDSDAVAASAKVTNEAKAEAQKLQVCFVSVDHVRDTPAAVDAFLKKFDEKSGDSKRRFVGLVGDSAEEVNAAARAWRVYFSSLDETPDEREAREAKGVAPADKLTRDNDTYQFDHSSAIYLVGPDGKMKDFFFSELGAPALVERLELHFNDAFGINKE